MDKELFISNIDKFAAARNESTSHACIASGAGKSFISDLRRGKVPSVAKVAALAEYLGVTTSLLIGDDRQNQPTALSEAWEQLNVEGRARLIEYAGDLVASGRYIKTSSDLGQNVG